MCRDVCQRHVRHPVAAVMAEPSMAGPSSDEAFTVLLLEHRVPTGKQLWGAQKRGTFPKRAQTCSLSPSLPWQSCWSRQGALPWGQQHGSRAQGAPAAWAHPCVPVGHRQWVIRCHRWYLRGLLKAPQRQAGERRGSMELLLPPTTSQSWTLPSGWCVLGAVPWCGAGRCESKLTPVKSCKTMTPPAGSHFVHVHTPR